MRAKDNKLITAASEAIANDIGNLNSGDFDEDVKSHGSGVFLESNLKMLMSCIINIPNMSDESSSTEKALAFYEQSWQQIMATTIAACDPPLKKPHVDKLHDDLKKIVEKRIGGLKKDAASSKGKSSSDKKSKK